MPAILVLYALGIFLYGAGEFLQGLAALVDTEVGRKYFQSRLGQPSEVVQRQPLLSDVAEALHVEFGRLMNEQYHLGHELDRLEKQNPQGS